MALEKFLKLFLLLLIQEIILVKGGGIFDYSHVEGEGLSIQAGSLSSRTAIIPYGYNKLGICSSNKIVKAEDTLGEIISGEVLYTTGHLAYTNKNKYCETLCYNQFTDTSVNSIKKLINRKYFANWYLDKLPAGLMSFDVSSKRAIIDYFNGIPLGYSDNNDNYFIYNHLQFHIILNKLEDKKFDVVGFNVLPMSIKHQDYSSICAKEGGEKLLENFKAEPQPLIVGGILFTYDTIFEYSETKMASRWDHYKTTNQSIHWAGIIISNLLIIILGVSIAVIITKNIKQDIDSYNYRVVQLESIEEYGWKDVAGDVFRAPAIKPMLLSSIIGTGVQLFFMFSLTLFLGVFGFMNPEKRVNILNIGILFFCFMGLPGGFVSSTIYKFFGGNSWLKNAILTSILFPGTLVFGYIIVDIILTIEKSTAAVRIYDILSLFILWLFCTSPLILIGSFLGFKSRKFNVPCKINVIPSVLPDKPWFLHYRYMSFVTGLICFIAIFIEFSYVMGALWNHQIYFLATFLWISFYIFLIVCGEVSVIIVYWNLTKGDYNWWWKSFIMGGSPVIYFILYSIYYFFYLKLSTLAAAVVYFGMMALISAMALFISGSVSVLFTFGFLMKIYSGIKKD